MRAALLLLLAVSLAACGDDDGVPDTAPAPDAQEYEASGLVLENAAHGPELCLGAIASSLPPQCGGLPLRRWQWSMAPHRESTGGTTWAEVALRGTYDGRTFTVTEVLDAVTSPPPRREPDSSPACPTPEVTDPGATTAEWDRTPGLDGPEVAAVWMSHAPPAINVVVRPGTGAAVRAMIRRTYGGPLCLVERDQRPRAELDAIQHRLVERLKGGLLTAATDEVRGKVVATVVVVTPELRAEIDREFGAGTVELEGRLIPVSRSRPQPGGGG